MKNNELLNYLKNKDVKLRNYQFDVLKKKQYQYTSDFDYRRRPNHFIINSIKRLRPFKSVRIVTELFDRQIKQPSRAMNNSKLLRSRERLQNTVGQTYPRSRFSSSYARNVSIHFC
ncbi:hypothetical protein LOAG_14380 [Loa loa]|uniref:Uncharacterized protein n=1 Tax=Loa loa TaxID=7209 RepID=A0A1S0TIB0_LOALO|nr:hypothetical protein LOAG_14380 [Loa loa]EFO14144.1 hypothetical protein LOAG_14380 [Loa loa]